MDVINNWNISHETIVIKIGNAPTQQKNEYAFHSKQTVADIYGVRIIRLYGEARQGKKANRYNQSYTGTSLHLVAGLAL